MRSLNVILVTGFVLLVAACSKEDGSKYVGHWKDKSTRPSEIASLDISDIGSGNYSVAVNKWSAATGKEYKWGEFPTNIKNGLLVPTGRQSTLTLKPDGTLYYDKDYVKAEK
jgi:hypothetical protein